MGQRFMFSQPIQAEAEQRQNQIENIGLAVTTCGTAPYVHLHLEVAARMFGHRGIPLLVCNDGDTADEEIEAINRLCDQYGADPMAGPHLGHSWGDLRSIQWAIEWAEKNRVDVVAKMSRRFIPLTPWRHSLLCLASNNPWCAAFARRHDDRRDGLFRTDCFAIRVSSWQNEKVKGAFDIWQAKGREFVEAGKPRDVNVEPLIYSLVKCIGGWQHWDLIGQNFYRPYEKAMQWRGVLPCHYGDLSRSLGLPYTDADFESHWLTNEPHEPGVLLKPCVSGDLLILGEDADGNPVVPDKVQL